MSAQVEPNSVEDFIDQFVALQDKAKTYGIATVVAGIDPDPLGGEAHTFITERGTSVALVIGIGAAIQAVATKKLLRGFQ